MSTAREFSPRVERVSARAVVCDVDGLERLFGDARAIASELRREAADRGVIARVAVAATRGAALLLAHARPGHHDRRAVARKPPRWRRCRSARSMR